jgi:hypothetical protein
MHAKELIAKGCTLAIQGLQLRKFEPCDSRTLRLLVRRRLRLAVRRTVPRGEFLRDELSAALLLAEYIIAHCDSLRPCGPVAKAPLSSVAATGTSVEGSIGPSKVGTVRQTQSAVEESVKKRSSISSGVKSFLEFLAQPLPWESDPSWKDRPDLWRDRPGLKDWGNVTQLERAAEVEEIARRGISNYQIGQAVGVDESLIRRMRTVAKLPKAMKTQISRGKSVNAALREVKDPVLQQSKRLQREKENGSMSDQLADQVVALTTAQLQPVSARQAVSRAKEMTLRLLPERLAKIVPAFIDDPAGTVMLPPSLPQDEGLDDREAIALRLVRLLVIVAPEPLIHTAALEKALDRLPKRQFPSEIIEVLDSMGNCRRIRVYETQHSERTFNL